MVLPSLKVPTQTKNQFVYHDENRGVSLYLKREDLLHPHISGNKFRKLKYNLIEADETGYSTLLTFGGAFSNHIAATAAAGKEFGFKTVGIIRGEELGENLQETLAKNDTLSFAASQGMSFEFIPRKKYREMTSSQFSKKEFQELTSKYGEFFFLPEGGTNALAIKGCKEILRDNESEFDYICCPVGTGGTLTGLIQAAENKQEVLGFSALKEIDFDPIITQFSANFSNSKEIVNKKSWTIITKYHFGGYARVNSSLVRFINQFKARYGILLDPIYTGKMLFGIIDMINRGDFRENTRILALHTGGIQGISGINRRLEQKGMQKIDV